MSTSDSRPDTRRISPWRAELAMRASVAACLRPIREGAARVQLVAQQRRGRGRMAVFLPAGPPEGAALLRIYNMARELRAQGWSSAVVPWRLTLAARQRYLAAAAPDVVVMQGARHALNRPGFYPDWPIVYDMDDADFHLVHLAGPVRDAMGHVAGVVAGSRYIAEWCEGAGARNVHVVWTGTPMAPRSRPPQATRPPVVAWAQTRPLTYRREARLVARVMAEVAARRPEVVLRLYDRRPGDDASDIEMFRAPGLHVDWRETCAYDDYLASFEDVAVGLAPLCPETPFSRGKSFGKVLAYLDALVPVVGSAACEHPAFFTPQSALISNDEAAWVHGIVGLVDDAALRQHMAETAFDAFARDLSTATAARQVAAILADVVAGSGPARQSPRHVA